MITIPYLTALTNYISYGLLFCFGQLRDFFREIIDWWSSSTSQGYSPICLGLEDFYIRRLYLRIQDLIQYLKYTCPAHLYGTSISPPAAQQIISAIKVLLGEDGSSRGAQKLTRIRENSNFFRSELQKMGFEVLGDNDSPVMLHHV